jgi:hypothetical protein
MKYKIFVLLKQYKFIQKQSYELEIFKIRKQVKISFWNISYNYEFLTRRFHTADPLMILHTFWVDLWCQLLNDVADAKSSQEVLQPNLPKDCLLRLWSLSWIYFFNGSTDLLGPGRFSVS